MTSEDCKGLYGPDTKYVYEYDSSYYAEGTFEGTILPTGYIRGFLVEEIWAICDFNHPSVTVLDPRGNALEIAKTLEFYVTPIVNFEEPAPMSYATGPTGQPIDQTLGYKDSDPTTSQPFDDLASTAGSINYAIDKQKNGGGVTLTMSTLDQDQTDNLAGRIWSHMGGSGRDIVETTYICGPEANIDELALGKPNGNGVVNSVNFSYSDSSSYTISVSVGEYLQGGLGDITGGPTQKMTEEVSARGTITQDLGNHIHYMVMIDGYGERLAINCSSEVLHVYDRVNVSVHNNPVEA